MCLCLVLYSARMLAYALLPAATYFVPIELLHGVTFSLFFAASVVHCGQLAPPGAQATMQGVLTGSNGLGTAAGALAGGLIASRVGLARMFAYLAAAALPVALAAWLGESALALRARRCAASLGRWALSEDGSSHLAPLASAGRSTRGEIQ